MAGPEDEMAARTGDRSRLRASHADREQVIGILKAAFVQGLLNQDEFDLRIGQAFGSPTYADLAAVTADIPVGIAPAQPSEPPRAEGHQRVLRPGRVIMGATVLCAGVVGAESAAGSDNPVAISLSMAVVLTYFLLLSIVGGCMLSSWHDKRSGGQPPRPSRTAGGGQAS